MSTPEVKVSIDPKVKPIYADFIIQAKINKYKDDKGGIVKLLLAQEYDNNIMHTETIVLPMHALKYLKDLIDSDEFNEAYQEE